MTTATVDMADNKDISEADKAILRMSPNTTLESEEAAEVSLNNHYYYTAGSFNFILDKGFKPETLENVELTIIPFVPEWNRGIISIHGEIMPVIDILSFVKSQKLDVKESKTNKTYLLKLEHQDYSPVVFSLDSIPHMINADDCEELSAKSNSPKWIEKYLKKESKELAFIDHEELFNQIINTQ